MNHTKSPLRGAAAVVVLVVLAVAWWNWADLYAGKLGNFVQGNIIWLLPLLVFVVTVAIRSVADSGRVRGAAVVIGVAALILGVYTVATLGYQTKQLYLDSVTTTEDAVPTFNQRAAYDVAVAQAPGNLGDVRGEIVDTTYLPDQDQYTSLVERPGFFTGYAAVQTQDVALTGQAKSRNCAFSTNHRLGGLWGASLERQIAHIKRGVIITDSDAYGACMTIDGKDTPIVVVPLKDHRGWFPAIEVPAGVAVYNGLTGKVTLHDKVTAGDLPGPVFPISLATQLRESTAAMGSYWDYVRNRVGFEDTSRDENDPNGANRAEFALAHTRGDAPAYVTPLTLRGRNVAISAVGVVEAGAMTSGKLNAYTVHDLPTERKANSAVADRLKTDYSDLPDWASGMRIFEIAPVSSDEWVASLGQKQNVAYRIQIRADGSSCLQTADGEQIRCGRATATGGNGPGVGLAPAKPGSPTPVPVPANPGELAKLTDAELAQLHQQLTDEVTRRLAQK